jgi:membrane protein DedA with SNARE-associated domain
LRQTGGGGDLTGLAGVAAGVIESTGELGVGLLTLLETVFPLIPSEVVLPLAGFLAQQGWLNIFFLLPLSVAGAMLGAVFFYVLGRRLGEDRAIRVLSRLPLVEREDFEKAAAWFHRHGRGAVFFGRLVPGVRSLISLPAGAACMPVLPFLLYTGAGTLLWNGPPIGLGMLLGTQYQLVDRYSTYLNIALYAAIAIGLGSLIIRRIRRIRQSRQESKDAERGRN